LRQTSGSTCSLSAIASSVPFHVDRVNTKTTSIHELLTVKFTEGPELSISKFNFLWHPEEDILVRAEQKEINN
jgi:hypothetical protein